MTRTVSRAVIAIAFIMAVLPGAAKSRTVKLMISGPGIARPLEVTDPAALANAWGGEFLAGPASQPDARLPRYTVSFYAELMRAERTGSPEIRLMYVVEYCRDPATAAGYVFLPGPDDGRYKLNATTILRDGQDGRWQHAAPAWNEAVWKALRRVLTNRAD
jgi:hypothetical protein